MYCISSFHGATMEGKEAKRPRTGPEKELLAANERDGVQITQGPRRRAPADTSSQSGPSPMGGASKGGKGKGKSSDLSLDLSGAMGGYTVLGVTGDALVKFGLPPIHDPANPEHNPAPPQAKVVTMHNVERGLRYVTAPNMPQNKYINIAGPDAKVGEAVEQDILNAIIDNIKSACPEQVNDLTRSLLRPKRFDGLKCTCESEWRTGMLGKNNSGAVLFVYFPDNKYISDFEKIVADMIIPECHEGTRPMNVCFIDFGAHPKCSCMTEIMTVARSSEKISVILTAMCEPTQSKYMNVKPSDFTAYVIQVNARYTKMMSEMHLVKSTNESVMKHFDDTQESLQAAGDVIRNLRCDVQSNKWAMFCMAAATNNVEAMQQMLSMKSEFMRLLDIPGDDAGEGAAASAGPETERNAPESDEMAQLFLDLVKKMPERKYEEMRARVLSAPLVTKAIEEQVAEQVKDFEAKATEAAIEARVAEAVKVKEAELEAKFEKSRQDMQVQNKERQYGLAYKCFKTAQECIVTQVRKEFDDSTSIVNEIIRGVDDSLKNYATLIGYEVPKATATDKDMDTAKTDDPAKADDAAAADAVNETRDDDVSEQCYSGFSEFSFF